MTLRDLENDVIDDFPYHYWGQQEITETNSLFDISHEEEEISAME